MGLDIYFKARKEQIYTILDKESMNKSEQSIYGEFDHIDTPDILKAFDNNARSKLVSVKTDFPIGCFRKFNALHGYIVDKCAGGVDDCKEIVINKQTIEKLIEIFDNIIKARQKSFKTNNSNLDINNISDEEFLELTRDNSDWKNEAYLLLPPRKGFFFGSTEVDELYYKDCIEALDLFKKMKDLLDYQEQHKNELKSTEVLKIICQPSW